MKKVILLILIVLLSASCGTNANDIDSSTNNENVVEQEHIDNLYFESQRNIWGADPGLGISVLHSLGYTGKGGIIAYADGKLNISNHEEFENADIVYEDFPSGNINEWHGFGVLSLILGKNIGTAPDVKCYYFGYEPDSYDQQPIADVIREVIRVNETLPEDQKIKMLGFSNNIYNIDPNCINNDEAIKATQEARDAGIMMFYCGENGALYYKEGTDRNDPENCYLIPGWEWIDGFNSELSCVPAATRTVAYLGNSYKYDDETNPGLSWTQPFTIGLYGIAISIDPTLTEEEIRQLNVSTAFVNSRGMRIINPCEFIAVVLERVGRDDDANELREAYKTSLENFDYQNYDELRVKDVSLKYENNIIKDNNIEFSTAYYSYDAVSDDEVSYSFTPELTNCLVKISDMKYSINDDGDYVITFKCITNKEMSLLVWNNPNADYVFINLGNITPYEDTTFSFVLKKDILELMKDTYDHSIMIDVVYDDADKAWAMIDIKQFLQ